MDPRALNHFAALAERGDVATAAEHLGISARSLTRSIQGLEQDLGRPLIVRDARGVVLTASGDLVLAGARRARSAAERFATYAATEQRTVRVAHVPGTDTLAHLLEHLPEHDGVPIVERVVTDDEQLAELVARRLDVAITTSSPTGDQAGISTRVLREDPLVVVAGSEPSAVVVPVFGRGWRAHDRAAERAAGGLGCVAEHVEVALGSGCELASLRRAARGRPLLVAASLVREQCDLRTVRSTGVSLVWRLAWHRDDDSDGLHGFLRAAAAAGGRSDWAVESIDAVVAGIEPGRSAQEARLVHPLHQGALA